MFALYLQLNSLSITVSTKSPLLHLLHATSSSGPLPSMHHSTESTTVLQTPTRTDDPRSSAHSSTQSSTVMERTSVSLPQPTLASEGFIFTGRSVDTQQTTTAETSRWIQHLKGYVILRDLERYLSRLARDYALLQAKHWQTCISKSTKPEGKKKSIAQLLHRIELLQNKTNEMDNWIH